MKRCLGYIRVSTTRQGTGVSLQEQKSAIEAYGQRNGLEVVAWFEEQQTAAKQGRRVFARMLAELEAGTAKGVIIHKIDRSARNLRDWADLAELIDRGVEVHFAHDALDLRSRGGRLSADIQAVVAADFIRNLREETRKGFYGRLKQGLYPLSAPIGYRDMGRGRAKDIDPVQGALVRQAFELYATGEWSFSRLLPELHRRGLRSRFGGAVTKNGLTTLLNNRFYMGVIHIRKTNELFSGIHASLVSKALYDRVQAVLRGRRGSALPLKNEFLFRRFLHCARCERRLVGEIQKGRYIYYRCHTDGCGAASINENIVDRQYREILPLLRFDAGELGDLGDIVEALRHTKKDETAEREKSLRLQVARCDDRLTRLTDVLIDGLLDKASFDARKSALILERRGLLDALENVGNAPSLSAVIANYLELSNTAQVSYETGIPAERRDVLISLTSNCSVDGNKPAITLRSPYRELVELRKSMSCDLERDNVRTFAQGALEIFNSLTEKKIAEFEAAKRAKKKEAGITYLEAA